MALEDADLLAARHLPQPRRLVPGRGHHLPPIRAERGAIHPIVMAFDVDKPSRNRPEPAPSRFVSQIRVLVRGADKDTLARLYDLLAAITWSIPLDIGRDESLEVRVLGPAHRVHLRYFDQPFAAQMLRNILAGRQLRQVVREIIATENLAGSRFEVALWSFEHKHVVHLAARTQDASEIGRA